MLLTILCLTRTGRTLNSKFSGPQAVFASDTGDGMLMLLLYLKAIQWSLHVAAKNGLCSSKLMSIVDCAESGAVSAADSAVTAIGFAYAAAAAAATAGAAI